MPQNSRITERGGALIYVFIGILLFGALVFVFSRDISNSSSTSMNTTGSRKAIAADIVSYANTVSNAVQSLLQKGCSETELSFARPGISGYSNSNSPSDKSCNVFDPAGGKVNDLKFNYPGLAAISYFNTFGYMVNVVDDVGTTNVDLVMKLKFNGNPDLCTELNKLVNPAWTIMPSGWEDYVEYTGNMANTGHAEIFASGTLSDYKGKMAGCYQYASPSTPQAYYFYKVLIPR